MKRTKIVCTMGPSTDDPEILGKIIDSGMDVARFNFSHGTYPEQKKRMDLLKQVRREKKKPIAILLDTKGPEVRTGTLKGGKSVKLESGQTFTLTTRKVEGSSEMVSQTYKDLPQDLKAGDRVLIDDGLIEMKVVETTKTDVICRVENGGMLGERKGVNLPNVEIHLPNITDKDKADILFGIEQDIDFIAASFVRNADAVREIRDLLREHDASDVHIIAKIENAEGIRNIDSIIRAADGVMVARGDMGVEIPSWEVPHVQRKIIDKCNAAYKPVIVATQMLDSMMRNPRPTRAEVTDVSNAIVQSTDAIMLSGETAAGKYPVEAVQMTFLSSVTAMCLPLSGSPIPSPKPLIRTIGSWPPSLMMKDIGMTSPSILNSALSLSALSRKASRHFSKSSTVVGTSRPKKSSQFLLMNGMLSMV